MLRIRYMSSQPKAKPLKRKPGKKRKIIYTAYYAKNTGHKCTAWSCDLRANTARPRELLPSAASSTEKRCIISASRRSTQASAL